jgi:hypothetical protein
MMPLATGRPSVTRLDQLNLTSSAIEAWTLQNQYSTNLFSVFADFEEPSMAEQEKKASVVESDPRMQHCASTTSQQ